MPLFGSPVTARSTLPGRCATPRPAAGPTPGQRFAASSRLGEIFDPLTTGACTMWRSATDGLMHVRWRESVPGAFLTAVGWIVASLALLLGGELNATLHSGEDRRPGRQ